MKRTLLLASIIFLVTACTFTVRVTLDGVKIELQTSKIAFNANTPVNIPTATETAVFTLTPTASPTPTLTPTPTPRTVTVMAGTNYRTAPIVSRATLIGVISVATEMRLLQENNGWYQLEYLGRTVWVIATRVVVPTPTPVPTAQAPTPTREVRLMNFPYYGYTCMSDECIRTEWVITPYTNYRVVFRNAMWAWVCVYGADGENCVNQFYVKVG